MDIDKFIEVLNSSEIKSWNTYTTTYADDTMYYVVVHLHLADSIEFVFNSSGRLVNIYKKYDWNETVYTGAY